MSEKTKNRCDDGNIPPADLTQDPFRESKDPEPTQPLPESTRPRKDGPGGE